MKQLPIHLWREEDRPREKLILRGKHALTDAELLAILLGTGYRGTDKQGSPVSYSALDLAQEVLSLANHNLSNLARLTLEDLTQIKGIGEAKAINLLAALELGHRRRFLAEQKSEKVITSSKDAYEILRYDLQDLNVEQFYICLLSRKNAVIKVIKLSEGGISGTVVDTVMLVKQVVLHAATSVIMAHNHPSGNLKPSNQDISLTRRIKDALKLLEVHLFDHLIITASGYYSFSDEGTI